MSVLGSAPPASGVHVEASWCIDKRTVWPGPLVDALWKRGPVRIYPNLRDGAGLLILNVNSVDYSDLRSMLSEQREAIYDWLWDSLSPQEAATLAAFFDYTHGQIMQILRRGVIERRGYTGHWPDSFLERLAEFALEDAHRFPEHFATLGLGRGPQDAWMPYGEDVALSVLEAGGMAAEALRVLQDRNDRHQLGFTESELFGQVQSALRLQVTPGSERRKTYLRVLHERTSYGNGASA